MQLLPIKLGVVRNKVKDATANNEELKNKIFERDGYQCRYCGFVSKKYQQINHINGDVTDNKASNLATCCIFCHQCFNLDKVSEMRSGVLIWLPEIEQYKLHHIARSIYVARISQGPMADTARNTLDMIIERREEAKKRIFTDDPYILSMVFSDLLSERHYAAREEKIDGIKLFPLDRRIIREVDLEFNQFPQILAFWRSKDGPFGGKLPNKWINMYKENFFSKVA